MTAIIAACDLDVIPVSHENMGATDWPRGVRLVHRPSETQVTSYKQPSFQSNYAHALEQLTAQLAEASA